MKKTQAKARAIRSRERAWADSAARAGLPPKPISVWEVLIPILLVFLFAKSRTDREVMVQNLLFTKEQALEAALTCVESGTGLDEAMKPVLEKTQALLESVEGGIYSERIRQEQLEEIRLLAGHYCGLLEAEGEDYDALVRNAYTTREAYEAFLGRLKAAERAVNEAALETLGSRGDPGLVARMEEAYARQRASSAERIFQLPGPERHAEA